jgi:hypothetical protein
MILNDLNSTAYLRARLQEPKNTTQCVCSAAAIGIGDEPTSINPFAWLISAASVDNSIVPARFTPLLRHQAASLKN